jgi:DNA-directed RNA polymerase subunit beta
VSVATEPSSNGVKNFARLKEATPLPNLLSVQIESYQSFLQADVVPEVRLSQGLQQIFQDIFPITDVNENFMMEFVAYGVGEPRYTMDECRERNMTFAAPLKATLRLISRETLDKENPEVDRPVRDIVEQDVYLGELPIITPAGTFVINGSERVIVSQLHRSPGVFFDEEIHPNGKKLFSGRIIPYRGSWVEFKFDINEILFVHIDSRRKLPVSTLLRAVGYSSDEEILQLFYTLEELSCKGKKAEKLVGRTSASTVSDPESGEIQLVAGDEITAVHVETLKELGIESLRVIDMESSTDQIGVILNTLRKDPDKSQDEALVRIYTLMRPGEPPSMDMAHSLLERLFFNEKRYDLGAVGRHMINQRLDLKIDAKKTVLDQEDFLAIIRYLIGLRNGEGHTDDIDHLGNRRARSVGELVGNLFSVGLSRVARSIRERLSLKDADNVTPHDLVNARTVSAVVDTFFGSSQLSQFMDQTNPLAELTHKRRLSALGPGGLTRERAGFEVRDVHHTHYGRMCPIETPEGPNIGLIASLASFARINQFGFLETPYRKVIKGRVTTDIEFLDAEQEDRYIIAQANEPMDSEGNFSNALIRARHRDDLPLVAPVDVQYMDVSPKQLVSVAASLIPFLEHDDANRALMGSNMQRQAVPLIRTDAPVVGTGMEGRVAIDSGSAIVARNPGVVEAVQSDRIVIRPTGRGATGELGIPEPDIYNLPKYRRSNQDTCISYRPRVALGQEVEEGQLLADGPATDRGELALGYNVLVGFLPWLGYNFEDAIIVSERLVHDDIFSSIHIEEFELQVRDTKRGAEELTREIPNVSEEALLNLDDLGVIRVGAEVEAGDILVGKVTPKGETELSPEERLLRAIFGEKAGDVRDASLKAPPGMKGVVIDTKVFSRKERTEEAKKAEKAAIARLKDELHEQMEYVRKFRNRRVGEILDGHPAQTIRNSADGSVAIRSGTIYNPEILADIDLENVIADDGFVEDKRLNSKVATINAEAQKLLDKRQTQLDIEIEKVIRGAELPPGVKQLVKVSISVKRKLSVGDKMAGRHGNKGVVARVVPVEDMPYLEDGTSLDIILNPLGVPSRMNVGQILETHLGWAAKKMGIRYATPVFDGCTLDQLAEELERAGLPSSGKARMFDGRTGEELDNPVTVGYIYMMKLSHLVDDKIHARSIGPYSLVTQQPLGGKAQFGGQRFGEMEVWALEAYGAAHALQEMLTVKSDDVSGRSRVYEALVKGENPPEPGVPESFNVLVMELKSLGLDVQLLEN